MTRVGHLKHYRNTLERNQRMHKDPYMLMFLNKVMLWTVCKQINIEEMIKDAVNKTTPTHRLLLV
jgi:hypothetical protein